MTQINGARTQHPKLNHLHQALSQVATLKPQADQSLFSTNLERKEEGLPVLTVFSSFTIRTKCFY